MGVPGTGDALAAAQPLEGQKDKKVATGNNAFVPDIDNWARLLRTPWGLVVAAALA